MGVPSLCLLAGPNLVAPGAEGRLPGQSAQGPSHLESMVTPSTVVTALFNGQEALCLTDTGSKVTVMEYDFYTQWLWMQDQLDPSWLSIKVLLNPQQ